MQNTRLTVLVNGTLDRVRQWLQNPWRRISVLIISLLFGNFLATAIATTSGQQADYDILAAAILVAVTEFTSWFYYRTSRRLPSESWQRSLFAELFNGVKIGVIYGMFLEAFKLGS